MTADKGAGFKIIETTADIGLAIRGKNLEQLFESGIKGMSKIIGGNRDPKNVKLTVKKIQLEIKDNYEGLLIDFLNELVSLVNETLWLPVTGRVKIDLNCLKAQLYGRPVEPKNIEVQIKAATYHNIKIEKQEDYRAKVIFDV